jgi:hypothetical protein
MDYLNRRMLALRTVFTTCVCSISLLASFESLETQAAPVTFRFDAQIVSVALGGPFDLPFEFRVGDTISGKFSFQPGPGIPINNIAVVAEQPFAAEFNIDGANIMTTDFQIIAFDNSVVEEDSGGSNGPFDGISLGCREASCIPDLVTLPNSDPFKVRWEIRLAGSSSVWSLPEITGDPDIWNQFTDERRIIVGFDDLGPGSVAFYAVINSFVSIPEPTLAGVFVLPALYVLCSRAWRH